MISSHPRLKDATRILGDLIAQQTEPPHGNLPMCEYVGGILRAAGFDCRTSRTADGDKESLFAILGDGANDGSNGNGRRGIVLSGHSDVVDASSQSGWQTPPFEMREKGGVFYGRGACDMKGFLACALAAAADFAKDKLTEPLYFAMSRDEEVGCIGMPDILALMREAGARPRLALVGEPTKMRVVAGHKSGAEMRTIFTGTEAHSSRPDNGVSAVHYATKFANYLLECGEEMKKAAVADSRFVPPFDTINIGVINGGAAKNIIAGHCEMLWLYRALPENNIGEFINKTDLHIKDILLPQMRSGGHFADICNKPLASYPGLIPDGDSPAVKLAMRLSDSDDWQTEPFGADAGQFAQDGIATAIIGPGDIAHAHKPNEHISAADLCACLEFLDRLRASMRD